jgi:hypothetical protein
MSRIATDEVPSLCDVISDEQSLNFEIPLLTNSKYYNIESFSDLLKTANRDIMAIFKRGFF